MAGFVIEEFASFLRNIKLFAILLSRNHRSAFAIAEFDAFLRSMHESSFKFTWKKPSLYSNDDNGSSDNSYCQKLHLYLISVLFSSANLFSFLYTACSYVIVINIVTYQRAKGERPWGEHKTGEKWEESKREGGQGREERNRSANILATPLVHERGSNSAIWLVSSPSIQNIRA